MAELWLEVVEGPDAGRRLALDRAVVVGRAEDADLVLHDREVSRHHARVTPAADDSVVVEDLGSTNGTFIDHNQVHGRAALYEGQDLLVGVTVLEARGGAGVSRQPSAVRPVPPALAQPERPPTFVDPGVLAPAGGSDELDRLTDTRTKLQARTAPLAVLVLVALVVGVYLGTR